MIKTIQCLPFKYNFIYIMNGYTGVFLELVFYSLYFIMNIFIMFFKKSIKKSIVMRVLLCIS
ncbi:hypothetical protein ACN68_25390 [Escherichia coli]|nr:hypothetical protein ACN68_25390 [Escherichia coli]OKT78870.1 hypothetical protein ACN69_24570 [Escherichia coli]OKU14185.1 hypothetical protein ACN77_05875 [Escherichia coli]OOD43795.1 hypothetical protein BWP18_25195 [Escherichia coli]OTE03694.1 hypothetical protein AW109_26055 [Escherichia coli]